MDTTNFSMCIYIYIHPHPVRQVHPLVIPCLERSENVSEMHCVDATMAEKEG